MFMVLIGFKFLALGVLVWQILFLPTYFTIQFIFVTIYESHCPISANFYIYLQYFQQKVFSFSKISGFQTDQHLKNTLFFWVI